MAMRSRLVPLAFGVLFLSLVSFTVGKLSRAAAESSSVTFDAIACDSRDVEFARHQYERVEWLVRQQAEQPIALARAGVFQAWVQHCAGRIALESYCRIVSDYFEKRRAIITREIATTPGAVSSVQSYIKEKLEFGRICE